MCLFSCEFCLFADMKVFSAAEKVKKSKNKDFAGSDYLASVSLLS